MTPWIEENPVRKGVYQRDHCGHIEYSYWTGHFWLMGRKTPEEAFVQVVFSRFQNLPWRGLYERMPRTLRAGKETMPITVGV
jgi:hypothetical protein